MSIENIDIELSINENSKINVIFINGFLDDYSIWDYTNDVKRKGIHILKKIKKIATTFCFNLKLEHYKLSLIQIVDIINELLKIHNINKKNVIIGHSYGGLIGQVYAVKYPENVLGLMLLDSSTNNDIFRRRIEQYIIKETDEKIIDIYKTWIINFNDIPKIVINPKIIVFSHINMKSNYDYAIRHYYNNNHELFYKDLMHKMSYYKRITSSSHSKLQLHMDATHKIQFTNITQILDSIKELIELVKSK